MAKLNDYYIKLVSFPPGKAREAVVVNEDGSHTIFIDSNLPFEHQRASALHAICHIRNCDFEKLDVQIIEGVAHDG